MQNQATLQELQHALDNAVANQRLEGLEPDATTISELECVVAGELMISDVIEGVLARVAADEWHQSCKD